MLGSGWRWGIAGLVVVLAVVAGLQFIRRQPQSTAPEPVYVASAVNLGIAYVTVTPRVSDYYHLDVRSGALVTDVVANSPADRAGIRAGDVILSFNGTRVEQKVPLLGMMRDCMAGSLISLQVWDGRRTRVVEMLHVE